MVTALDKKTALVLIDLQKGIVQYPVVHPISDVLKNAAKLVEAFRKAGLPIVIVNVNPAGAPKKDLRKDALQQARTFKEDWLEITPEIKTQADDIFITKHTWGAFFETALDKELKKRDMTGIVLGGVSTSIGVDTTARQANERGYNIAFAKDAMTDMNADAHEHSLKIIFPRIGEIDETDKIIEKLF
jgi:nicotinamidase-related amidase